MDSLRLIRVDILGTEEKNDEEKSESNNTIKDTLTSSQIRRQRLASTTAWSKSATDLGDDAKVWKIASLSYSSPYQHFFIWEAEKKNRFGNGFFAVDDVKLFRGHCRGSCNFDADFCAFSPWRSDLTDFEWRLSHGSLKDSSGPLEDKERAMNRALKAGER